MIRRSLRPSLERKKARNPRLKDNQSLEDVVVLMDSFDLPYPKKMDFVVRGHGP